MKPSAPGIVGVWNLAGPRPKTPTLPLMVTFDFRNDGEVKLTSVETESVPVSNGNWNYSKEVPRIRHGTAQYKIVDAKHLRLIGGGNAVEYVYELDGDQLILAGTNGSYTAPEHVYNRQH